MTRIAALLAGLAAVACPASATPIPEEARGPGLYFPTQVGARWTYRFSEGEYVLVVTGVEKTPAGTVVSVGLVEGGGTVAPHSRVEVSPAGLRQLGHAVLTRQGGAVPLATTGRWEPSTPAADMLRLRATPGDQWRETFWYGEVTLRAARPEEVTVPAGRFPAVPVDLYVGGVERPLVEWRHWYAPGVGPVKWRNSRGHEFVLAAFYPGRG